MQDTIIIEAGRTERHYWRDLWRYQELFTVQVAPIMTLRPPSLDNNGVLHQAVFIRFCII